MHESEDDRKKRLRDIIGEGERINQGSQTSIFITGKQNVTGDGNVINYGLPKIIKKVHVQTGVGTITAAQKKKINDKFNKWVFERKHVRKTDSEYRQLRAAFNRHMNVNSYHEILQEDFDKAIKWLNRQIAIINSMPSAKKKIPDWRKNRYASINAQAKKHEGGVEAYRRYAEERFGTSSLRELTDDQLEAVYRYVTGRRRTKT